MKQISGDISTSELSSNDKCKFPFIPIRWYRASVWPRDRPIYV